MSEKAEAVKVLEESYQYVHDGVCRCPPNDPDTDGCWRCRLLQRIDYLLSRLTSEEDGEAATRRWFTDEESKRFVDGIVERMDGKE